MQHNIKLCNAMQYNGLTSVDSAQQWENIVRLTAQTDDDADDDADEGIESDVDDDNKSVSTDPDEVDPNIFSRSKLSALLCKVHSKLLDLIAWDQQLCVLFFVCNVTITQRKAVFRIVPVLTFFQLLDLQIINLTFV